MRLSRRTLLQAGAAAGGAFLGKIALARQARNLDNNATPVPALIETPVLTIAYEDRGNKQGFPVLLLHGFPDDIHAWDEVTGPLVKAGYRTLVPYLRGYGGTRFRDPAVPRTAEQAAIAQDVVDFADAARLPRFAVVGYDWGGRAACITAALHPDRVRAAVLIGGYTIQNTITAPPPADPKTERALWYQWYFNTDRGRAGLQANRGGICRLLWETWSPGWHFSSETFNRTATSFDNPDFVDVVIHSYRHRYGNAPGETRFEAVERELAQHPKIQVPSIVLHGARDGVTRAPEDSPVERASFTKLLSRNIVAGAGHFLPREKPETVSNAVLQLLGATR
jgi:pimeloyl-ACP methyl ester carboxylesterase